MKQYTFRTQAGIAIIAVTGLLALVTHGSYYALLSHTSAEPPNGIKMNEERFRGIRALLPQRAIVGYLSDTNNSEETGRAYFLTQYYLAPVVVAADTAHELVIANCRSRSAIAALAAANDLTVERDFSNGVALLHKRLP